MRMLISILDFDRIQSDIEILIDTLQYPSDAKIVLQFYCHRLIRQGLEDGENELGR